MCFRLLLKITNIIHRHWANWQPKLTWKFSLTLFKAQGTLIMSCLKWALKCKLSLASRKYQFKIKEMSTGKFTFQNGSLWYTTGCITMTYEVPMNKVGYATNQYTHRTVDIIYGAFLEKEPANDCHVPSKDSIRDKVMPT